MTLQKWGAFLESVGRRFDGPTSLMQRIALLVATGTDGA